MVTEGILLLLLAAVVGLIHFALGFENNTVILFIVATRCFGLVHHVLLTVTPGVYAGLILSLSASLLVVFIYHLCRDKSPIKETELKGPLRPLIFPCRTTHARLFPKKHGFTYSYLTVGIPIGWSGSVASMVGADEHMAAKKTKRWRSWLGVDAGDYLGRGNGHLLLKGKLEAYLESQVMNKPQLSTTCWLMMVSGRFISQLWPCLPCHCSTLSRLCIQSGLFLVFVLGIHEPGRYDS